MRPAIAVLMFAWASGVPVASAHLRLTPEMFERFFAVWAHMMVCVLPIFVLIVWKLIECQREERAIDAARTSQSKGDSHGL